MTMAWVHLNRGDSAEAIASADRVLELAPNWSFAHAARGLALLQQARFLEASRSVRRALRLNPRAPTGLLMSLAQVNFAAGRRKEAVDQLEHLREANADHIASRVVLAAHYEREGQHDQASDAVGEILRVNPDFSVDRAEAMFPNAERVFGSQEFAEILDALRAAGLP